MILLQAFGCLGIFGAVYFEDFPGMRIFLLTCLFLIVALSSGQAQVSGVTVVNNLTFGDVFPGIPKQVDEKTPGSAAEFSVTGVAGSEVQIDFTLPTYMNNVGYNMQLIFNTTDCSLDSSASADQTAPLGGQETMEDILKMAIGKEKDSVIFYLGMKEIVSPSLGRDRIDAIIMEEMNHIGVLSARLASLSS